MDSKIKKLLDRTGQEILAALQENARLSYSELGRRVGLTTPAIIERIKKMEEAGIITGYHVGIDLARLGQGVTAFIRLTTSADRYPAFLALVQEMPEVLECHHVTGAESFMLRVAVSSVAELEPLIARLSRYGETATSLVLSSPIVRSIGRTASPW